MDTHPPKRPASHSRGARSIWSTRCPQVAAQGVRRRQVKSDDSHERVFTGLSAPAHQERDAGELADQSKLIISTEEITWCLKLASGRLLSFYVPSEAGE